MVGFMSISVLLMICLSIWLTWQWSKAERRSLEEVDHSSFYSVIHSSRNQMATRPVRHPEHRKRWRGHYGQRQENHFARVSPRLMREH